MKTKDRYSIQLDGTTVTYTIRRSRRAKRVRMTIEDNGSLLVTVPVRNRLHDVPATLRRYKHWILKKISDSAKDKLSPPFGLTNGSALKVLDRTYTLSLHPSGDKGACWRFKEGFLIISSPRFSSSLVCRCVELWYRKMARLFLEDRVPHWAKRLNVRPKAVRIKNQRTLWGSCSLKHNLNFNWRILLLSQAAAEYLVIHELAHLKEPNHSPEFWDLVESHCPEFRKHKNEIRRKSPWLRFPGSLNPG